MKGRQRVFVAINLPKDITKALARYQDRWPELPAKWTSQDNLHITLVFLGDITNQELADVCATVKQVAERHKPFMISLNTVAYGPKDKMPPRYIWAGGAKSQELSNLHDDAQQSLADVVRFPADHKPFSPHITLARIQEWQWRQVDPEEQPEVQESIDLSFDVESIEVMESELKRGGPVYATVESHQLQ